MCKLPGSWRSFEELEECLTLEELTLLLSTHTKIDNAARAFTAALKGIDLSKHEEDDASGSSENRPATFEEIKARAAAKAAGVSQDEFDFGIMGIGVKEIA